MKPALQLYIATILFVLSSASCTKNPLPPPPGNEYERIIQFALYTQEDLSNDNDSVHFSVFIKDHGTMLFDSLLYSMKIKDIPDSTHSLLFEKSIPDTDSDELSAGFRYTIQNVGSASFIDTIAADEEYKSIEFSFR